MALSSETIYAIGLALIGVFGLIAILITPIFLITGNMLRKRLEDEYGIIEHTGSQRESGLHSRLFPVFAGTVKKDISKRHRKR